MPVPRPVATPAASPVSAQVMALAEVVFPIPISPMAIIVSPAAAACVAIATPAASARRQLIVGHGGLAQHVARADVHLV